MELWLHTSEVDKLGGGESQGKEEREAGQGRWKRAALYVWKEEDKVSLLGVESCPTGPPLPLHFHCSMLSLQTSCSLSLSLSLSLCLSPCLVLEGDNKVLFFFGESCGRKRWVLLLKSNPLFCSVFFLFETLNRLLNPIGT